MALKLFSPFSKKKSGNFRSGLPSASGSFGERHFKLISILPAILILVMVIAYPLYSLFRMSFTNVSALNLLSGTEKGIGLNNYLKLLKDPIFIKSILNTLYFTVISVGLQVILAIILAMLVFPMKRRVQNLIITLLLFPAMIADVAVAMVWKPLLDASTGLINYYIGRMGFSPINFLGDATIAMWTVIIMAVWQWTPYMFIFVLSGMQALSTSYYEVAELEGANVFQKLRYVILPLIKPVLMVAIFFRITSSIRVFDKVYVLTGGGPGSATETISTYIQRVGFTKMEFGLASAGGVIMLALAAILGFMFLKSMYKVDD